MRSIATAGTRSRIYREFFPTDPPARTVCGARLIGGHKVEIECVALA
jgi:enamine deaminase RidA (YjgF/YER057c/UK114 family)